MLHAAVLSIDLAANLCHVIALLYHLRRIQRLVLTKVHSGCRVAIDEAREKTTVSHVPVAFAITIELIENVWNLLGHLISHGCLSDKKSWRHRCFRLPPYIAAGSLWLTIGKPAWRPCANPTPCKQSNNQGNHQTTDPKTSFTPGRRFSLVFSSIFSHDGSFLFPQLFPPFCLTRSPVFLSSTPVSP